MIVHDEYTVGLEHPFDVAESLSGKEVALETNICITTMKEKGVHEGVDYKVILVIGRAQKMPTIV